MALELEHAIHVVSFFACAPPFLFSLCDLRFFARRGPSTLMREARAVIFFELLSGYCLLSRLQHYQSMLELTCMCLPGQKFFYNRDKQVSVDPS